MSEVLEDKSELTELISKLEESYDNEVFDTQMGDLAAELAVQAGLIADDERHLPPPTVAAGRKGIGADVADVVAWLAGDGARYVTGVTIPVDGGWAEGL